MAEPWDTGVIALDSRNALSLLEIAYPQFTELDGSGEYEFVHTLTDEEWEELGQNIANNAHLKIVDFPFEAVDDHKISCLFRGLTGSNSVKYMNLQDNAQLSVAGVSSMVPFLQNANNFIKLELMSTNMLSEGFNFLMRALRDSQIQELDCSGCGITSIDIDINHAPKTLLSLELYANSIDAEGCREITKLLQRNDSALKMLNLNNNEIDDECVAVLVDALRHNQSLTTLYLEDNNAISQEGQMMILKLVNDVSSIESVLQSNHTLRVIVLDVYDKITTHINMATTINNAFNGNPEVAGRMKVIRTQLDSEIRAELASLQGVNESLFNDMKPILLPEVLSLIGYQIGLGELYIKLKSSIDEVISIVDRKQLVKSRIANCELQLQQIQRQLALYTARSKELYAELAEIEAAEMHI